MWGCGQLLHPFSFALFPPCHPLFVNADMMDSSILLLFSSFLSNSSVGAVQCQNTWDGSLIPVGCCSSFFPFDFFGRRRHHGPFYGMPFFARVVGCNCKSCSSVTLFACSCSTPEQDFIIFPIFDHDIRLVIVQTTRGSFMSVRRHFLISLCSDLFFGCCAEEGERE